MPTWSLPNGTNSSNAAFKRQNLEPSEGAPVPSLCMTTCPARPVTSLWVAVHTSRVVKSMLRWQGSWGGWQLLLYWVTGWILYGWYGWSWLVHFQCSRTSHFWYVLAFKHQTDSWPCLVFRLGGQLGGFFIDLVRVGRFCNTQGNKNTVSMVVAPF